MNLIVCDRQCRHQSEGYCGLDRIARLTGDVSAKCGYFEAREKTAKPRVGDTASALEYPHRL